MTSESLGCESIDQEKKVRKRKKKVHAAIREQLEFYFGDSNLAKDKFLAPLIHQSENGYVDISIFMKFNKIRKLTNDVEDIKKALASSEMLQLSDDMTSVRRVTPIQQLENTDICTLYVENLPPQADHDWIKEVFHQFGKINYVSLPRFSISNRIKGFAFIEFDTADSVDRACKYFSIPKKAKLLSTKDDTKGVSEMNKDIKRNLEKVVGTEESEPPSKKLKQDHLLLAENKTDAVELTKESTKESRKRKKRYKEKGEIDISYLVVMPKKEWKRFKNKYVALQKANMAEVKKYFGSIKNDYSHPDSTPSLTKNPEFIPGAIIKLEVEEPFSNSVQIRSELKSILGVSYVDIHDEKTEGFIRCQNTEVTNDVLKYIEKRGKASVLTGQEELEYWENVFREREVKMNSKVKIKKRGCDKIMQKAVRSMEISNKHIRFDE